MPDSNLLQRFFVVYLRPSRQGPGEDLIAEQIIIIREKFMRKTASLTLWDHKRNGEILKNVKLEPVSKFIQNYRAIWKDHIERMDSNRITNTILNYRAHGKRCLGRPLKRWSETVTGHLV
jgi:hypothetical protein